MKRTLEPELMEDQEQTLAYSNANFAASNQLFIRYILENSLNEISTALDLGCGPADVAIDLAKHLKSINILAIDGSSQMIDIARQRIEERDLANRIEARIGKLPNLSIATRRYHIIISKDLLHHLPDPGCFWEEIERLSNNKTQTYVMDLIRPDSKDEAQNIVEKISSNEPEILKIDFYNSLLAAFTMDEINEQLAKTNLTHRIERLGNRHFVVKCSKSMK